jgi:ZIP family zinc transporter
MELRMKQLGIIGMASWLAGIVAFVGGFLAHLEGTAETEEKQELIHGIWVSSRYIFCLEKL